MASLVLASGSPRRIELLTKLGTPFEVRPADVDESPHPQEAPDHLVGRLAASKARAVADRERPGTVVLGADTVVTLGGEILGKPIDEADAARMLRTLSGRTHVVLTGVAVAVAGRADVTVEVVATQVTLVDLGADEIDWYVASGEPLDKAGAYGIQGLGGVFVSGIVGSWDNVVGLPLAVTRRLLAEVGIGLGQPPLV